MIDVIGFFYLFNIILNIFSTIFTLLFILYRFTSLFTYIYGFIKFCNKNQNITLYSSGDLFLCKQLFRCQYT